jgi:hypothetical protein
LHLQATVNELKDIITELKSKSSVNEGEKEKVLVINQENDSLKQSIERIENEMKLVKDNHLIEIDNLNASFSLSKQELLSNQALLNEMTNELEREKEHNSAIPTPSVFDSNNPSPEVLAYVKLQVFI